MEPNVNYTFIGGFVLTFIMAMIAFIMWTAKFSLERDKTIYDIYFNGSITGLEVGSKVRYRGFPVGNVSSIELNPNDIETIRVRIAINKTVPIKKDTVASLLMQGITGNVYVQLSKGTSESPMIRTQKGHPYPIIKAVPSTIDELIDSFPKLMTELRDLTVDLRGMFTQENRKAVTTTLNNLARLTDQLSNLDTEEGFGKSLNESIEQMRESFEHLDDFVNELNIVVAENRESLKQFTGPGLASLNRFLEEGTEALGAIKRIGESIERSPTQFLFKNTNQGVPIN